jgi:hypothetical protein
MRIVNKDNFDGDYPNESFVNLPSMPADKAMRIADVINQECSGPGMPRFWDVVSDDYELQPGFEP